MKGVTTTAEVAAWWVLQGLKPLLGVKMAALGLTAPVSTGRSSMHVCCRQDCLVGLARPCRGAKSR